MGGGEVGEVLCCVVVPRSLIKDIRTWTNSWKDLTHSGTRRRIGIGNWVNIQDGGAQFSAIFSGSFAIFSRLCTRYVVVQLQLKVLLVPFTLLCVCQCVCVRFVLFLLLLLLTSDCGSPSPAPHSRPVGKSSHFDTFCLPAPTWDLIIIMQSSLIPPTL